MASRIEWNKFVIENNGLFLQSWEWGEFQKLLGRKIWRLGDGENWAALVVRYDLPLEKSYLYCPAGPVAKLQHLTPTLSSSQTVRFALCNCFAIKEGRRILAYFLDEVKKIAKQEKSIFLKIEPFWAIRLASPKFQRGEQALGKEVNIGENGSPAGEPFSQHWINLGFKKASGGQRVLETLVLDLNKTEEELLAEMKQKTRYNIKLAEKHGVKTRVSASLENDFKEFWRLMQGTAEKNKIRIHPKEYYQKQLLTKGDLEIKLFMAESEGKIAAANIVAFFGKRATYLHGASDYENRHLMAPYLLQWEQIKEAKKRGCEIYDFWGIDEAKWPGITRFKTGFGGKEISYIGAFDYVFDRKWYFLYNLARRIKKC